jgi:hypothetical protein
MSDRSHMVLSVSTGQGVCSRKVFANGGLVR